MAYSTTPPPGGVGGGRAIQCGAIVTVFTPLVELASVAVVGIDHRLAGWPIGGS